MVNSLKNLIRSAAASMGYELQRITDSDQQPASKEVAAIARYNQDGLSTVHNCSFMQEPRFAKAYAAAVSATGEDYQWHWRVHIAFWSASRSLDVQGDFVECGVNRGFLSYAIMSYLKWNDLDRTYNLLDTFQGMDARYVSDAETQRGHLDANRKHLESGFYVTGVESVRKVFQQWDRVSIVEGTVPDSLSRLTCKSIAFLHIDMNCAPPEVAALEALWPKISAGGIVLLDDYAYHGHDLQKDAMDDFAERIGTQIASLPTGQGLLIKPGRSPIPAT